MLNMTRAVDFYHWNLAVDDHNHSVASFNSLVSAGYLIILAPPNF